MFLYKNYVLLLHSKSLDVVRNPLLRFASTNVKNKNKDKPKKKPKSESKKTKAPKSEYKAPSKKYQHTLFLPQTTFPLAPTNKLEEETALQQVHNSYVLNTKKNCSTL